MDQGNTWIVGLALAMGTALGWIAFGGAAPAPAALTGVVGVAAREPIGPDTVDAERATTRRGEADAGGTAVAGTAPRQVAAAAVGPVVPIAAVPLARELLDAAVAATGAVDAVGGWSVVERAAVVARVRDGRAAFGLLADRLGDRGSWAGEPLAVGDAAVELVELGDLVLVAIAPRSTHPEILTGAALRRLLSREDADWASVRAPRAAVRRVADRAVPAAVLSLLLRLDAPLAATGVDDAVISVAASRDALAVVPLAALERARSRVRVDDLILAVDCIEPTRAEFRAGRYPLGASLRVVVRHDADAATRAIVHALRTAAAAERLHPALLAP